jgi:hypothetical protein
MQQNNFIKYQAATQPLTLSSRVEINQLKLPFQATQMPSQGLSWQYASQAFVRNQALLLKALQCFSAMHLTWAALPSS